MTWTKEQIEKHKKAADLLYKIMKESFEFISKNKNTTEYKVQQFILKRFDHYGLITDRDTPIVAFRENTAFVHYFPSKKSKKIEPNSLILIDIWARLKEKNSPFADITWMGFYGKRVPKKIEDVFKTVLEARDACILEIENNLRKGKLISGVKAHGVSDDILIKAGFSSMHGTGHSIGFRSPHGSFGNLNPKGSENLKLNLGYTIEPGVYLKDDFGSEIDFYIDEKKKMQITTKVQGKIFMIKI